MIEFLLFGGHVFQQTVGIPIGTNCTPLQAHRLVPLFARGILHTGASEEKTKRG